MKSFANNPRRSVEDQRVGLGPPVSNLLSSITLCLTIISQFSAVVSWADISECDLLEDTHMQVFQGVF